MPKVSVIVPSYNHGDFLEVRIESILNQTFKDFEVFLLDDCSTDQSWEIIEKYTQNPQVKLIHRNEANSGSPFLQWQYGANQAAGEYLWIAESDDFAEADFIEKHLAVMEADKSIGVSFSPSIWVDLNGVEFFRPSHEDNSFIESGNNLIVNEFSKGCLIYNSSSALFRKELVKNVDFDLIRTYKYTGDWLFWVQLVKNTKVSRIANRLNYFRRHDNNVSFKSNKAGLQFSEGYKVVKYIFRNHKVNFLKRWRIDMFWALKVAEDKDIRNKPALKLLPAEISFWYRLLPILKFFNRLSK